MHFLHNYFVFKYAERHPEIETHTQYLIINNKQESVIEKGVQYWLYVCTEEGDFTILIIIIFLT